MARIAYSFGYFEISKVLPSQYKYLPASDEETKLSVSLGTMVPMASPDVPFPCEDSIQLWFTIEHRIKN